MSAGAVAALIVTLAGPQLGQGVAPPIPSGRLDPAQKKRLTELDHRRGKAAAAGRFAEILQLTKEMAELRRRWQGAGHWEVVDEGVAVQRWQRLAALPLQQQKPFGRSIVRDSEGAIHQAQGRYREAEKAYREALTIRRNLLGEDHPETATSYSNLAMCLVALGRHDDALPLLHKALAIQRKAHGEEHRDTALACNNMAFCLKAQGEVARALPLFEKALTIWRKVLGEQHPFTCNCYTNLASCLQIEGRLKKARPLFEKALAMRRGMLGEEHPDTAISYSNLAYCLHAQGKQPQPLYQKALAIQRRVLGEDHPYTAQGFNNLAHCLDSHGEHARAQPLYEKALAILRKTLGDEHPHTALTESNLASCLAHQGKHADALVLHRQSLASHRRILGDEHPDTSRGYNNLAHCLDALGKHVDALPLHQKALAICRQTRGEEHPDTAHSYNNVAACLDWQGKYTDALPLYQKALAANRKMLGEDHPHTAHSYTNVATCLLDQGHFALSLPLLQKALAIYRKGLGETHPCTARAYFHLGYCLLRQGKRHEAIRCWQAALPGRDVARLDSAASGFDRSLYMVRAITPRSALAVIYAQLKMGERAWQYAEADLARGLLDDLIGASDRPEPRLAAHLRQLDQRLLPLFGLLKFSDDQEQLREELSQQRRDVLAELSKFAAARSAAAVWSQERIQKQIPPDAALVLWLDFQDAHWGCVLRQHGPPRWQRLPGSGRNGAWTPDDLYLTPRLYRVLANLRERGSRHDQLVQAVRQQRLEPLRQHFQATEKLPAVRQLLVIPTGMNAWVPVEVLAPEFTVSYIPSGTVFARLMEQHRPLSGSSLLAVGDPVFNQPTPELSDPPSQGLLVKFVMPDSNAARAGIRAGDVLLSYRDVTLHILEDLDPLLAQPGRASAVRWRNGETQTRTVAAGHLGITFDPRSARAAVRAWRRAEEPLSRGEPYRRLPGTRFEVEALRRLAGAERTTRLLGSLASGPQLDRLNRAGWLKRFRLIHLATHGHIDEASPARSALILSRDRLPDALEQARLGRKVHDGQLTVRTILSDWRLDADLVVLSACETALGKDAGGNGLLGFAHAFLARGARSVVLSRWKVDDTATALLMVRFYENLLGKRKDLSQPLPRAEALAEAKRWLRELSRQEATRLTAELSSGVLAGTSGQRGKVVKLNPLGKKAVELPQGDRPFAHPFFWAAFVLIGDPD
jgi:tetratricopeptide (TPR) repeat protein